MKTSEARSGNELPENILSLFVPRAQVIMEKIVEHGKDVPRNPEAFEAVELLSALKERTLLHWRKRDGNERNARVHAILVQKESVLVTCNDCTYNLSINKRPHIDPGFLYHANQIMREIRRTLPS